MGMIDSAVVRAHNMLLENASPERIPGALVQAAIIQDGQRAGREYRRFLENGAKLELAVPNEPRPEDIRIHIPALPRPSLAELQAVYSVKEIERDTSPIKAVTLRLATAFSDLDGDELDGKEYERRLKVKLDLLLGFQQAQWLVEHQDEFPEFMALLGEIDVNFAGIVVVYAGGRRIRGFPELGRWGERWSLAWCWLNDGANRGDCVAISQ